MNIKIMRWKVRISNNLILLNKSSLFTMRIVRLGDGGTRLNCTGIIAKYQTGIRRENIGFLILVTLTLLKNRKSSYLD